MASRARAEGTDPVASSLMVQLISLTAATGAIADARADARLLLEYATEVGHVARQLDARGALLALEGRSELVHEGISELQDEARRVMNVHPIWKTLIACYRSDVVRGDEADAEYVHRLLIDERPRVNRAYHNSFDGLAAFGSQLDDPGELLDLAPPTTPTLFSLPNVLASAEAVAIGGSLCNAAEWIAWLGAELPAYVVTSLEWPACRARIEALLWLRLGQRSEAIERLRRAVACCEERGDVIEAEIGRAQLAAIEGDATAATQARQRLAEFGIDASRLAGAADRVVERARLAGEQPFTVDEGRALARLVRGCSQREIEAELELRPRGAARLLTSSYRKLGVRGRIAAIEAARERQVA